MRKRLLVIGLILSLLGANLAFAVTSEVTTAEVKVPGFWTEVDITFWQTAPFMIFWGYVIDQQISAMTSTAGAPHWEIVLPAAALVSLANAYNHAKRVEGK